MRANNKEPTWSLGDKVIMGFIIGLHAFGIWYFIQRPTPELEPPPVILQVAMITPPEEQPPPPPEPPKPPPPQPPKVVPKTPPPIPVEQPKVVTEVPVQAPIPPPPPAPPAPPAPPPPAPALPATFKLVLKEQPPKPTYPRKALRDQIQGTVSMLLTVDERGIPIDIQVTKSSGNFELDTAAKVNAMKYRFIPYQANGIAVKMKTTLDIVFKLSDQ